jgi:NAD(P)-dependent dehydrogenase (short-subunit alcohol dehydrogenase family)
VWWRRRADLPAVVTGGVAQEVEPGSWREHHFGLPPSRWKRLSGKSFWITGAGTGYGRCIALALAAAGAQVFISGRRIEKLRETLSEGVRLGIDVGRCVPMPVDITQESQLAAAVDAIGARVSHLDGLVHSAALPQPDAGSYPLLEQSAASWTTLLATNVMGPWLTSRIAMPLMSAGGEIRMVFLSSEAGWAATPGFGPYNISKSALNSLGASLAAECDAKFARKDVQINVLVPGEAHTEMNHGSAASPYCAVSMTLILLSHPAGGPNGCFFHRDGRHLAFAYALPFPHSLLAA